MRHTSLIARKMALHRGGPVGACAAAEWGPKQPGVRLPHQTGSPELKINSPGQPHYAAWRQPVLECALHMCQPDRGGGRGVAHGSFRIPHRGSRGQSPLSLISESLQGRRCSSGRHSSALLPSVVARQDGDPPALRSGSVCVPSPLPSWDSPLARNVQAFSVGVALFIGSNFYACMAGSHVFERVLRHVPSLISVAPGVPPAGGPGRAPAPRQSRRLPLSGVAPRSAS